MLPPFCLSWTVRVGYQCIAQEGWTALMLAVSEGHTDCVRLLIDNGADKEAKDEVRYSAHSSSSDSQHDGLISCFVFANMSVDFRFMCIYIACFFCVWPVREMGSCVWRWQNQRTGRQHRVDPGCQQRSHGLCASAAGRWGRQGGQEQRACRCCSYVLCFDVLIWFALSLISVRNLLK